MPDDIIELLKDLAQVGLGLLGLLVWVGVQLVPHLLDGLRKKASGEDAATPEQPATTRRDAEAPRDLPRATAPAGGLASARHAQAGAPAHAFAPGSPGELASRSRAAAVGVAAPAPRHGSPPRPPGSEMDDDPKGLHDEVVEAILLGAALSHGNVERRRRAGITSRWRR